MSEKCIAVVSANYRKAYPVIKSVYEMGFKVIALFYKWSSPIFSRYVSKRYLIANPYADEKRYVNDVISLVNNMKPLMIIPIGFIDTLLLSKYKQKFPSNIIIPIPEFETITYVSRKDNLVKLCERIGIKYPQIYSLNEYQFAPTGPVVVKGVSDASKPEYVFFKESLSDVIKLKNKSFMVQDFVPGVGCGYFALAKNGSIIVDYTHVRVIEEKPSGGPSVLACLDFNPELIFLGRKIVKELKWTGVIMAEFRRNIETGDYYLLEINPKLWGSLELATSLGIDIPKCLIEVFLFNRKPKLRVNVKSKCFTWILSGLYYLKLNPGTWFRMLKKSLSDGLIYTDLHFDDPSESLYSLLTRLIKVLTCKHSRLRTDLNSVYRRNLAYLSKVLRERRIKCIIFDFDGTLVKLDIPWNEVKAKLVKDGLIKPWDTIMIGLYKNRGKKEYHKIDEVLREYENKAIKKLKKDRSLNALLKKVSENVKYMAIVSKQGKQAIERALDIMGISKTVSLVVDREAEILRLGQLKRVLDKLGALPEETLMFGDTIIDIVSALKLNITPISVTDNPYRFQQYIEYGVPCFKNVKEALKYIILQWRCGK